MKVRIIKPPHEIFDAGEVVEFRDELAKDLIGEGYAEAIGCPECGAELVNESGCRACFRCGWSKCG